LYGISNLRPPPTPSIVRGEIKHATTTPRLLAHTARSKRDTTRRYTHAEEERFVPDNEYALVQLFGPLSQWVRPHEFVEPALQHTSVNTLA
jgi:hypothetical protein